MFRETLSAAAEEEREERRLRDEIREEHAAGGGTVAPNEFMILAFEGGCLVDFARGDLPEIGGIGALLRWQVCSGGRSQNL